MQLDRILNGVAPLGDRPPVDQWAPELSGEMDLVIARDGRWIHEGSEITRAELVRLFARILRREDDGHYCLVTPIEKWRISVEDHPFVVVDAEPEGDAWALITNVGERVVLGHEHRLTVTETPAAEAVPEVNLRLGLAARLGRNVFYRLAEHGELAAEGDRQALGLTSGGVWQPLGRIDGASEWG
ncbi:DUF1285 domain-containing protein [Halomonas sp. V046]|uniref:DUF1285 domain-containing protein n=1 Tax=Halomonas sp. V046 TaxID=3459611 RepID=UPI004044C4B8